MKILEWKQDYNLNIAHIDGQHSKIVDYINQIRIAAGSDEKTDIIYDTLNSLREYSQNHFREEEFLMKENNYNKLEEHINQHNYFISRITDIRLKLKKKEPVLLVELTAFLFGWLIKHICIEDKKYAEHIKANEIRPNI
ncbi:hypothetical protein BVY03_00510 [bacterium K02(2017)]|nr:hypothetical protein BVY03_00510 [bacterium K02(2017)]